MGTCFFRNSLNIEFSWSDFEKLQANLPPDMKWETVIASYHQNHKVNGIDNVKYVSADGHFEVVYNANNVLQTKNNNPDDMGTYNYRSPNDWLGHYYKDILPYNNWGNVSK